MHTTESAAGSWLHPETQQSVGPIKNAHGLGGEGASVSAPGPGDVRRGSLVSTLCPGGPEERVSSCLHWVQGDVRRGLFVSTLGPGDVRRGRVRVCSGSRGLGAQHGLSPTPTRSALLGPASPGCLPVPRPTLVPQVVQSPCGAGCQAPRASLPCSEPSPLTRLWMSSWYWNSLLGHGCRVLGFSHLMRQWDSLHWTVMLSGGLYCSVTRPRRHL